MSFFRTIGAKVFASGAALALSALALSGCETQAFCFQDCGSGGTAGSGGAGGSGGQGGTGAFVGGQGGCGLFGCGGDGGGGSMCVPNGAEVCDGTDNDCDGTIDNVPGIDYANVQTCGTCSNNCVTVLGQQGANCSIAGITCQPSADPGNVPGTCVCTECASDYFDLNGDGICEYYCVKSADDDTLCNAKDDDCDGVADEDVDLCTSPTDCGKCGGNCSVVNGTGQCVASGGPPCDTSNTQCAIAACDPDWYDIDNSFATGCEYNCVQTNGGVEICGDGLDNDCDGLIDGADDLSGDPAVGVVCFGDPDGECAKPAHAGVTACVSNQVVCTGPDVLVQGQVAELCNNLDDDCDGATDDAPTDVGQSCGASNQAPCQFGTVQCLPNGVKQCVGNVDPVSETCDGLDNDCNGTIDDGNLPTIGDPCNVPIPPPNGATSACMGGVKACTGGVIDCVGDVLPVNGAADTCGVDQNCDGTLTNQPNTQSDVANCGACGNDCYAGSVHANWACVSGACVFQGCQQGYYDNGGPGDVLAGDNKCGYACTFVSAQEACNGQDDDCDGLTDEAIATVPQASQVCGTSGAAITAECKGTAQGGQIQISCVNGGWQCTFPAGVCAGGCSANDEICDTLDNDCDGLVNENVPNWNQPCASDDAAPGSHGVCKTTGTFVCNGANATQCSAVKASCAGLPGGCTEVCDGLDNDCDGTADDLYNGPASTKNDGFFVKPTVTKIGAALWIYTYEASRPSATNVVPGNGNGYTCTGAACVGVPTAPAGETLDKTKACSVPNKIPWFNVTPIEVEQTCQAMGGSVCTTANFQTACTPNAACTFGYNPRGAAGSACATGFTASKFCNLGPSFDFSAAAGDQDGLLPTASGSLQNCWADWSGLQSNTAVTNKLYDLTGNLREITKQANNDYRLMGGAFDSASEAGAACGFTFYSVTSTYKYFDTGFRCCFTTDPTL